MDVKNQIKSSSKIDSYLQILDIIRKNNGRQLTVNEVFESSNVGYTRTVNWLKYLREAIQDKRPYVTGYKFSTKINTINHRPQWIYWFDDSNGVQ